MGSARREKKKKSEAKGSPIWLESAKGRGLVPHSIQLAGELLCHLREKSIKTAPSCVNRHPSSSYLTPY